MALVAPLEETGSPESGLSESERAEHDALAAQVDAQMREYEADLRRLQRPGMRHAFLIASWTIIVPYFAVMACIQFAGHDWTVGLLFAAASVLATQLYRLTMTDDHKALARRLSKIEDVRCIGRLSEALEWPDAAVQHMAITGLTRLLNRVKASDRILLTTRQRGNLHRMLVLSNAMRHSEFLLSILRALEQIGDATAVPYVEQLAKRQPVVGITLEYRGASAARRQKVREAAANCLEYLKQRAELDRSSQTLLRASSASLAGTETLVRPVNATGQTDHEQLLRAGPGFPSE